jgi:hypothetical protein
MANQATPWRALLTPAEASRAIYLDFEGRMNEDPAFVGVASDGRTEVRFEQSVHDPALLSAAKAKSLTRVCLSSFAKDLAEWIRAEDRVIVSWSERELEVFRDLERDGRLTHGLPDIESAYRNGIRTAKDYRRRQGDVVDDVPTGNSLAEWMRYFGYSVPHGQGPGLVAAAIHDVRTGLAHRRDFDALTGTQKGKWTRALLHNRHDCLGMRFVCRRILALED